jgi:hypothetical protein
LVASTEHNPEGFSRLRWNAYERTAAYSWAGVAEEYDKLLKCDGEVARARLETEARVVRNE